MDNKLPTCKFYSNALDKEIEARILEYRKYTLKLQLDNGKVIIKKKRQIL